MIAIVPLPNKLETFLPQCIFIEVCIKFLLRIWKQVYFVD